MKILFFLSLFTGALHAQALNEKENLRLPATPWTETKSESRGSLGCKLETKWFKGLDPVTNKASGREVHIFNPENKKPEGLVPHRPVILLPPTGGTNVLDRRLASYFCSRNVTFYILAKFDGFDDKDFDLTRHDRQMREDIAALKELIQWIGQPVDLIGASLGALYGVAAAGADPQIKKIVLTAGGIDLPGILTDSEMDSVKVQKINRKRIHHLKSDLEYLQLMKNSVHYDPGIFLDEEKNSERFLLFLSKQDDGVPTKYQNQMAAQLPKAKKIYFDSGHVMTIFKTYVFHRQEIFEFLEKDKS